MNKTFGRAAPLLAQASISLFACVGIAEPGIAVADQITSSAPLVQTPAQPGSDSGSLAEVIVTARKRNERLLDVPETVVSVSAEEITAKGIESLEDVGRQTSNLSLNTRQDFTTDVVIRGIGAYGDVLGVGFTIDDVPNFTDQAMRVQDMQSIEILKGPQGTLYGGSAIGGEIIYHSKKPSFDSSGEAFMEAGSFNTLNAFAAQNFSIVPEKLAMRLSGFDAQSHGYLTNNELGIDGNPSRDYGVRAAFLFNPTDTLSVLMTLRHSYFTSGANEYIPVPNVHSFSYDAPLFEPTHVNRNTSGAVLRVDDSLGDLQLTSISSYTRAMYDRFAAVSFTPPGVMPYLSLITLPGNRPVEVATQEFRLTSPSSAKLDWLFGLYAADIKDLLINKSALEFGLPPAGGFVTDDFDTERVDLAAFGSLNYHLGNFAVGGGLRVGQTRVRAHLTTEIGGLPDQFNSITSDVFLPKLTLSYTLPGGGLIYANATAGEEPGGINTVTTAPLPYQAEKATSYEVGTKGEALDRRVAFEFVGYYINHTNAQVEVNQLSSGGLITLINNIGDSRSYGVEGSTTWRVVPRFTLNASAGYLNARWKNGPVYKLLYPAPDVPIGGLTPPNAPELTANVGADYSQTVYEEFVFHANLDASYTSQFWWDVPNTLGSQEPAYWITNARASLGGKDRTWEVGFRVANLFGTKYWTEYYPYFFGGPGVTNGAPNCTTCTDAGAIGAPRTYMLSILFRH
jgi:iron complex outermembrane receptor protein